jgi:hypothetical protein
MADTRTGNLNCRVRSIVVRIVASQRNSGRCGSFGPFPHQAKAAMKVAPQAPQVGLTVEERRPLPGQDVAGHEPDNGLIGVEREGAAREQGRPQKDRDQQHDAGGEPEDGGRRDGVRTAARRARLCLAARHR